MRHLVNALYIVSMVGSLALFAEGSALCVLTGLAACFAHDWIADHDPDSPFAPEPVVHKPGVIYL